MIRFSSSGVKSLLTVCSLTILLTMTDGSKFECHFRHEWMVHDRNKGDRICVYETQDLIGKLKNKDGHSRFHMPLNPVIEGRCTDLPVNPYTFGAWLGDGTNKKPRITICNTDYSIVESIINDGYEVIHKYDQEGCAGYEFSGLKDDLQKIGLCHSRIKKDKYIPEQYLTSSIEQALLCIVHKFMKLVFKHFFWKHISLT